MGEDAAYSHLPSMARLVDMTHKSHCRRYYDDPVTGRHVDLAPDEPAPADVLVWHTSSCESPADNAGYAAHQLVAQNTHMGIPTDLPAMMAYARAISGFISA